MAAPTWATDPLATALQLIGYHTTHSARLFNRSARTAVDLTVAEAVTNAAGLLDDTVSITLDDITALPDAPFFARLDYDDTAAVEWVADTSYLQNAMVIPVGGTPAIVAVCVTAGTSDDTDEPTWPDADAVGATVEDGTAEWVTYALGSEVVKVTVVTPGGIADEGTLTVTRQARGLPLHAGGTLTVADNPLRVFPPDCATLTATGVYVTVAAVSDVTPAHTPDDGGAALGDLLYRHCGLSKSVGKRVYDAATANEYSLTITTVEPA